MSHITVTLDLDDMSITYDTHRVGSSNVKHTAINTQLVTRQKCDSDNVATLLASHVLRASIFDAMEKTDDVDKLKRYDRAYAHLQRCQQELWGFDQDDRFLRYWDVPKCGCPQMDNNDTYGTGYNITSEACPIHWNKQNDTK